MPTTTTTPEQCGPSSPPRTVTTVTPIKNNKNQIIVDIVPTRLSNASSTSQSMTFSCSFGDADSKQSLSTSRSTPTDMTPLTSLTTPHTPPTTPLRGQLSSQLSTYSSSPTPKLGSKMMYERYNRDPFLYYKNVEVIGVGSMGSVSRVTKRLSAVGGSARLGNSLRGKRIRMEQQMKHGRKRWGGFFSHCCGGAEEENYSDGDGGVCFGAGWIRIFNRSKETHNILTIPSAPASTASQYDLSIPTLDHTSTSYQIPQLSQSSHHSINNKEYALKSIHLNRLTKKAALTELQNEIEILKTLDHPHIVKPIESYQHQQQIYLVMEMCCGGDLYSRDPYSEEEGARIIGSVIGAIKYMHKRGVVHRDLKFENIMFVNDHPQSEVKLIDFGLSVKYGPEDPVMSDGVGTIYTMAPEVLKGKYTSQADLWSIGILAYMLLSSRVPFYGSTRREIASKIKKCQYDFKGKRWNKISPQAKNFVSELLVVDPKERPTAEEASQSVWLHRRFACTLRSPDDTELDNIQATLQNFAHYSKLKKLALMVVAHKSTSEEIGFLRKAFEKYDDNHDGFIDFDDFRDALKHYGYSEEEIVSMFLGADIDSTGSIKYTEFLAATIEAHGAINEERLAEAFDRLDTDDSGYITAENLQELLGDELPLAEIKSIISECGLTNDHQISYEEFLGLWDQYQEDQRGAALQQIKLRKSSTSL